MPLGYDHGEGTLFELMNLTSTFPKRRSHWTQYEFGLTSVAAADFEEQMLVAANASLVAVFLCLVASEAVSGSTCSHHRELALKRHLRL